MERAQEKFSIAQKIHQALRGEHAADDRGNADREEHPHSETKLVTGPGRARTPRAGPRGPRSRPPSRPEQNALALAALLAPLDVLAFDDDAAADYGTVRAGLERAGTPIGSMDLLIAAHALALGRTVVTNNTRDTVGR